MDNLPHVVILDTGACWKQSENVNLVKLNEQSFYNEPAQFEVAMHCDEMLSILSANINSKARVSIGKVINSAGSGTPSAFSHGLIWAASLYPDVVVIPLGLVKPNSSVKAALEILDNTRCKIFASVGNPGLDQQGSLYPAAYPECIAVGSACFQQDYNVWEQKPNIIMQDINKLSGSLRSFQMGSETATMFAVAEYINNQAGI